MSTEAQKKASANYAKKMTKCVNLAFNKKNRCRHSRKT